ncbi:MAG: class I SAM-dependent methyltransferase, partial [Longimicrobiales bacterium]
MRANVWRALGRQIRRPSGWFGRALGRLMSWEHRELTRWAIAGLDVAADHDVLDIGCGGGAAVASLAGVAPRGIVVGLDYSAEMTRQARRRTRGSSGSVCIMQGRVETLPFGEGTFDRVVAIESFFF